MTELEWFSRNSYNLALELRRSWPLDYSLRLLNVSVKVNLSRNPIHCRWVTIINCESSLLACIREMLIQ